MYTAYQRECNCKFCGIIFMWTPKSRFHSSLNPFSVDSSTFHDNSPTIVTTLHRYNVSVQCILNENQ